MRLIAFVFLLFPVSKILSQSKIYIVNTNIVDVINMKILPSQTLEIENGKIISINKTSSRNPPAGSKIINGDGKYLMPGLVDAHVHFFQSGGIYTRPDVIDLRKYFRYENEIAWTHRHMDDLLKRYTAAGITTVIDVGSSVNFLKQRDSFQNKSYAPSIFMTGPLLTTWEPVVYKGLGNDEPFLEMLTAEDARKMVRQQLPYKPDFIKIWFIVRDKDIRLGVARLLPMVSAVIDEAHQHGLKVAVHATEKLTAQSAVETGADYLVHGIDDEIVDDKFLELLIRKKTIVCPTLAVGSNYREIFSQGYQLSDKDHELANPFTLGSLFDLQHLDDTALTNRYKRYSINATASQQHDDSVLRVNLSKMVKAGITIATGTDAGNIGTLHASSYFEELAKMKQAGMSDWQILQSSTINGAKVLGKENEFGSIEKGRLANMILLDGNPADNLENLKKVRMVINKGEALLADSIIRNEAVNLVEQQLNAYNDHNLEAFLRPYADDVEIYSLPGNLQSKGKEAMRKSYDFLNHAGNLHCEITNRIVEGNIIVDHEKVVMGDKVVTAVAIYTVENGKIKTVHFGTK